jgi:hypothetical protein
MKLHSIRDNRGILDFAQVDNEEHTLNLKVIRSSENLQKVILDNDFEFLYILVGSLSVNDFDLSAKDGLLELSKLKETPDFKLTGVVLLIGHESKIR